MNRIRESLDIEKITILSVVVLLQLAYLLNAITYPNDNYGFNQLNSIHPIAIAVIFIAFWTIGLFVQSVQARKKTSTSKGAFFGRWWMLISICIAAYAYAIFYLFNNNFINPDGLALLRKIPKDVPILGAHITHDEMLELYLHSRFWFYTKQIYGWSVEHSYRVLSSLAGALFVFLLFMLTRLTKPSSKFLFLALMLSGGYIQLFFGDVENYTLVSVLILLYLCLAYLYIENRIQLWVMGFTLSIALCFHLLAGWLIPSLVYLFTLAWKKNDRRGILFGFLGFITPLVLIIMYFHWNGLPIDNLLYRSHALGVLRFLDRYFNLFQGTNYIAFLNLLFLLLPAMVLLPILMIFRRIGSDPFSRFLLIAAFSMLVFVSLWRLQLGVYQDWNLVAPAMIPLSTLISFRYARISQKLPKSPALIVFVLTSILHTSMWILSNHFYLE